VSFSGIDGAGKSAQIEALQDQLQRMGLHVVVRTFWDDVVAGSRLRETISLRAFRGDKGIGRPEKPIHRRDKNVRSWYVTAARFGLYALDAISLRVVVSRIPSNVDVVIFDRYIFDELANLPLGSWAVRLYIRGLNRLVPKPDVAYVLDADPYAAYARKPEYPPEFVRSNRDAYIALSRLLEGINVIGSSSPEEAKENVAHVFATKCASVNSRSPELAPLLLTTREARSPRR
jgi:thymidylate kinase